MHAPALRALVSGLAGIVMRAAADQHDRWPLWLPVAFGAGVAGYFALASEPPSWAGPVALVGLLPLIWFLRQRTVLLLAGALVAAAAGGFTLAKLRADSVAAPVVERRTGPVMVTGRVVSLDISADSRRVVLDAIEIPRFRPDRTPARVRLRLNGNDPVLYAGDRVSVRAVLLPPPAPAAPGAFDFQRRAWFQRIGAVGFTLGPPRQVERAAAAPAWLFLERLRQAVHARILEAAPGQTGAVASALITGERAAIPQAVFDAMRDSGLAHLLAISGLHIGLVAGFVFFAVRGGLALWERVALRYDIKKWAAWAALLAAAGYTLLSGATVPTQRAFLMTGLVLLAVLLDRSALTMRLVAWAAFVVLLWRPESLLGASFQLSFAAVTALIAAYEGLRDPMARWRARRAEGRAAGYWAAAVAVYLGGVLLTTVIAASATAPFAAYHFNRLALFGVLANLLAVPLAAFWIMPWALVSLLLMPMGAHELGLAAMGAGINGLLVVAEGVAALPGAASAVPAMPGWGLALIALGGLWLCLWRRAWRFAGLVPLLAGLASPALLTPPDVLVSGDGRLVAVRQADGSLAFDSLRRGRFDRQVWLRRAGTDRALPWPVPGLRCDAIGCVLERDGQRIAIVRDGRALADDCRIAHIVVSLVPVRRACPSAVAVVDRFDLWRGGAHALWISPNNPRIRSVNAVRGDRPWVLPRLSTGGSARPADPGS